MLATLLFDAKHMASLVTKLSTRAECFTLRVQFGSAGVRDRRASKNTVTKAGADCDQDRGVPQPRTSAPQIDEIGLRGREE